VSATGRRCPRRTEWATVFLAYAVGSLQNRFSGGNQPAIIAPGFEIIKDQAGKFRFHLKAADGEIVAASQGYETKESAHKGIESVKTSAPDAKVVDLTEREPAHN
jgi:uncharacterized protein